MRNENEIICIKISIELYVRKWKIYQDNNGRDKKLDREEMARKEMRI